MFLMQHKSAGFTLVEILVAFFIFSVLLLGVAKGYLLVNHQLQQLQHKKQLAALVYELVQRGSRNPQLMYFKPSVWPVNPRITDSHCQNQQPCSHEQQRSADIGWFLAQLNLLDEQSIVAIVDCQAQRYTCLVISMSHQGPLEFIVGVNANAHTHTHTHIDTDVHTQALQRGVQL